MGDRDDIYRAWLLGASIGALFNHLLTAFRGEFIVRDPTILTPEVITEQKKLVLKRVEERLQIMLILYRELQLGALEDLRTEIRDVQDQIAGIRPENLPNKNLENLLWNKFNDWMTKIGLEMRAKSIFMWGRSFMGLALTMATLGYFVRSPTVPFDRTELQKIHSMIESNADNLRLAFVGDTIAIVVYTIKRWESFVERLSDPERTRFAAEINRAVDLQYDAWRQLLTGEKLPTDFLRTLDQTLILSIPVISATAILSTFTILLFLALRVLNLNLTIESLTKLNDMIALVLSGGLSAFLAQLVRLPFSQAKEWVLKWRIKKSVTLLPSLKN